MIIVLGFTCLVAVAVLEGVTGIPEQHNNIEEQLEDNTGHGIPIDIQVRKPTCKNIGGKCIKTKKDCPNDFPLENEPGTPYCSKQSRCCYPDPTTAAPTICEACPNNSGEFAIQHIESGLWVQPVSTENGQVLRLHEVLSDIGKFTIKHRPDTILAHVKHFASGRYWHPYNGSKPVPENGTVVVIHRDDPFYTLFTFDQATDIIKHQMGLILAPNVPYNAPESILHLTDKDDNAHFKAVHYNDPSKEFLIYGNATVTAYWRLVFALDTPAVSVQTFTEVVAVGHSQSLSSQTTSKFAWEVGAKAQFWFIEMSASLSVANEVRRSSAETWSKSVEQHIKITVEAGQTVALWQRFFQASQFNHFSVQQSNQYAQTNDSSIKPDDAQWGSNMAFIEISTL